MDLISAAIQGATAPQGTVRIIRLEAGNIYKAMRDAETALLDSEALIFIRAGDLVTVENHPATTVRGIERDEKSTVIKPITAQWLFTALSEHTGFERLDLRGKKYVPVDPPMRVCEMLLAQARTLGFPRMAGIIECQRYDQTDL
jgi:hypothetical protein